MIEWITDAAGAVTGAAWGWVTDAVGSLAPYLGGLVAAAFVLYVVNMYAGGGQK